MKNFTIPSLVGFCFLFSFNFHAQTDVDFRLFPTDCEYSMTAFLAGGGPDYSAFYDWGDGSSSVANWAYVEHMYDEPGIYTVTAIHNGITYVDEISIEDCGCPEEIEYVTFNGQCNQVEIRIDTYLWSYSEYSVEWDFGNGQGYTSNFNPVGYGVYDEEGVYQVTAVFTGPGCEDGITLTTEVEIEFCESECYPYVEYYFDENSCTHYAYNETGPEDTEWYLDEELIATGTWVSDFEVPEGEHTVCAVVEPNDFCPFGQTTCFEVEGVDCGANCDFELWAVGLDCQALEFEIGSASEVSNVTWDLGFGEPFVGSHYEVFTFPEGGEYEVCYSYYCYADNSFHEGCETVFVEPCDSECAEIFVSETEECGVYDFSMQGDISGNAYCWEFWNGEYFYTYFDEQTTTFEFTESGTYYITVTNAEFCEGQEELIYEITVPECEESACIYAAGGVQTGCTTAILTAYADFEIEEIHWLLNGEVVIAGNNFEYDFGSAENQIIEIAYIPGLDCNDIFPGWEIPIFMDTSWCQEDCFLDAFAQEVEDGTYVLTANPSDPEAVVFWEINGEYYQENPLTFEFNEPGIHSVCAFYESESCPFGVEDCLEVVIAPEECPEITYELTEDCNTVEFSFSGLIDGSWYCWDIIGEDYYYTYFDGETTLVVFPGPGTYLVGVTNALLCDELEEYFVEIVIPECENECEGIIEIAEQECNEILFAFPESASQIFISFGDQNFEESLEGSIHDYSYAEPGFYEVCTEYYDLECEQWVGDCITVEIEDCGSECDLEVNIVDNECGEYVIYFPSNEFDLEIDFGDGTTYLGNPNYIIHHYQWVGEYLMVVSYYSEQCEEWLVFEHLFIIEEDCEINCEYEIEVESLGDNTYVFYASVVDVAWTNWIINGQSHFNQNPLIYTFEEAGEYDACFEMETDYCSATSDCFTITVMDEEECEGVTVSLEGLFNGNEFLTQTLDCILSEGGIPFWDEEIVLNSEESIEDLEFCLPQGCYEFSVSNADPLVLRSLLLLIESLDETQIEYELELDILEGLASIQFGIDTDCETSSVDSSNLTEVGFYPVPASDVVFIEQAGEIVILEVMDTQGKLVFSAQQKNLNSIDVSTWSEGMYLFRYLQNGMWNSRKVQVNH